MKRRGINVQNLSAQEITSQEGTRFPQENVNSKRPQGTCPSQSEGKKASYSLIFKLVKRRKRRKNFDITEGKS